MTIVDRAPESSDPSTYQNQPGSSDAVSPGDMDAGSASWGAVSSLNDVANHTLSLGPVPGAVVYSASAVPEKAKPSPQKDQGTAETRVDLRRMRWSVGRGGSGPLPGGLPSVLPGLVTILSTTVQVLLLFLVSL